MRFRTVFLNPVTYKSQPHPRLRKCYGNKRNNQGQCWEVVDHIKNFSNPAIKTKCCVVWIVIIYDCISQELATVVASSFQMWPSLQKSTMAAHKNHMIFINFVLYLCIATNTTIFTTNAEFMENLSKLTECKDNYWMASYSF